VPDAPDLEASPGGATVDAPGPEAPRLRADAQRNLERIMSAAIEVFADQGTEASVDEIARRAGVGHGTVFRRFPTKDDLIVAALGYGLGGILAEVEAAAAGEDAWASLRGALEVMVERQHSDRAFFEAICQTAVPGVAQVKARLVALLGDLLRRAQASGQVRADLTPEDLGFLLAAAGSAVPLSLADSGLWRRYLGVILDGLRPECASPLKPPPPTPDVLQRAIAERKIQPR
jgi:AcrR family transcriptional regulator